MPQKQFAKVKNKKPALPKSKPPVQTIQPKREKLSLPHLLQRAGQTPETLSPVEAAQLQRTVGNRALGRLNRTKQPIQAKLTLGPVGDKYEQEADAVSKEVVNKINRSPIEGQEEVSSGNVQQVQRQEEDDELAQAKPLTPVSTAITPLQRQEEDDELVQGDRSPMLGGGPLSSDMETAVDNARGGGTSLSDDVRQPMENAFNADFSNVKIHNDSRSHNLNESVQARAFTTGQDIFFRQGEYNPNSTSGQELLAHELTHTVQQGATQVKRKENGKANDISAGSGQVIQRDWTTWKRGAKVDTKSSFSRFGKNVSKGWSSMWNTDHTQKAGKTVDEVMDPANPISKVLRQHMRRSGVWVHVNFLRDYFRLVNNPENAEEMPYDDAGDFLRKYADIVGDAELVGQYRKGRPLRAINNLQTGKPITRTKPFQALIENILEQAKNSIQPHIDTYNTQHGRQAAPAPAPPVPKTDNEIFQEHGVEPTKFTTGSRTSSEELGSGAVNTVYKHEYEDEEDPYVFKAEEDINIAYGKDSGSQVGIPEENPNFMKRSVAMYKIDQLLGADIITKTHFAVSDGQFGIVSELAKGKERVKISGEERDKINNDPAYQKALSRLQLIDIITGQLDRHTGNFFIETDGEGNFVAIKGIDNDMAFGKDHTDIWQKIGKGYVIDKQGNKVMRAGPKMGGSDHIEKIGTIDAAFAQRILALDPNDVRDALRDLISEGEIAATITRLNQLKDFLRDAVNREVSIALSYLDPNEDPGQGEEMSETEERADTLMSAYASFKAEEQWAEALAILQDLRQRVSRLEHSQKDSLGDLANVRRLEEEYTFISKKLNLPVVQGDDISGITVESSAEEAGVLWSGIKPQLTGNVDKAVMARLWEKGSMGTKGKILAAMGATGDQLKMSKMQYVLEAIDDEHRLTLKGKVLEWYKANNDGDFFTWLESNPSDGTKMTVNYAEALAKEAMHVQIGGGQLHQLNEEEKIKPMDTSRDADGFAVVLSSDNEFYSAPKTPRSQNESQTKHSTFLKGLPVESAGRMKVKSGKLTFVENYSGHYNPGLRHLIKMFIAFQSKGVAMDEAMIQYIKGQGDKRQVSSSEFLSQAGEWMNE